MAENLSQSLRAHRGESRPLGAERGHFVESLFSDVWETGDDSSGDHFFDDRRR
jgi:hypothetical protein